MIGDTKKRKCYEHLESENAEANQNLATKLWAKEPKNLPKEVHFETLKKEKKLSESMTLVHFSKGSFKNVSTGLL